MEENIYALSSDGQLSQDIEYGNPSLDLDNDGEDDIDGPADFMTIQNTISAIGNNMSDDDMFFLFVTNHGGLDVTSNNYYINIYTDEGIPRLYDYQLDNMLNSISNYSQMVIVMGQCYSGGFINSLEDDRRSIYTATDGSSFSYYTTDQSLVSYGFDEFLFYWTACAYGFYPILIPYGSRYKVEFSNFEVGSHPALSYDIDPDLFGNTDSVVQLNEIFNYANMMDVYSVDSISEYFTNVNETPMSSSCTAFSHDDLLRLYGYEGNVVITPVISGKLLTAGTGLSFTNYLPSELEFAPNTRVTMTDDTNLRFPADINVSIGHDVTFIGEKATLIGGIEPDEEIIPGNYIEIAGECSIGTGFSCNSRGNSLWDGIYFRNVSAVNLIGASFSNCLLYKENGSLHIQQSDFFNSGIHCEAADVSIAGCDTISYLYSYNCNSVDISSSVFSGDADGIVLDTCGDFCIENSYAINNTRNGIYIKETLPQSNYIIRNCLIENNLQDGLRLYHSYADIEGCEVKFNSKGIVAYRNSVVSIHKNTNTAPYEHDSYIANNQHQEILYTNDTSLQLDDGRNRIVDNTFNTGSFDQYLIQCPNLVPEHSPYFRNNFWGYMNTYGNSIIPPESRFYPSCLEPMEFESGYYITPLWTPGVPQYITKENDELVYTSAVDLAILGDVLNSVVLFKQLISAYPESRFAPAAAKNLLALEEDKQALKDYYATEPNLHWNGEIDKLADYLENYCNIKLGDYQAAISWFEDIISDPDCELDSLMAVIDLGYVYLLMQENSPKAQITCQYPQLVPKSRTQYEQKTNAILSALYSPANGANQEDGADTIPILPQIPVLHNNYPNPFNPSTSISFSLPAEMQCSLSIYNIKGQKVTTLQSGISTQGNHTLIWNGRDDNGMSVSSGIYFYQLKAQGDTITKKMIMVK